MKKDKIVLNAKFYKVKGYNFISIYLTYRDLNWWKRRPKIHPSMNPPKKRLKEIVEEGRKICSLPDSILVDIISHLDSTEEAIRTSILSRRWQYLWPLVSNLIFTHDYSKHEYIVDFLSKTNQVLNQCGTHFNLNKFQRVNCINRP